MCPSCHKYACIRTIDVRKKCFWLGKRHAMVILKTNEVSFSCVNNEVKKTRGRVAINDASFLIVVTI